MEEEILTVKEFLVWVKKKKKLLVILIEENEKDENFSFV